MDKERLGRAKQYLEENGMLTEQQESILQGIYREKTRWMKKSTRQDEAYSTKRSI
jgi:hypothetical protein